LVCDEKKGKRVISSAININMEGWGRRGRPKNRWIDCVRQDMRETDVSDRLYDD
jgi:hypothetical protein